MKLARLLWIVVSHRTREALGLVLDLRCDIETIKDARKLARRGFPNVVAMPSGHQVKFYPGGDLDVMETRSFISGYVLTTRGTWSSVAPDAKATSR